MWIGKKTNKQQHLWLVFSSLLTGGKPLHLTFLVSQATTFAKRGRVWSRCNRRVVPTPETWCDQSYPCSLPIASVVMEYKYVTTCLSASYYLTTTFDNCVPGDNSVVTAWPDPSSLGKGCGLQDHWHSIMFPYVLQNKTPHPPALLVVQLVLVVGSPSWRQATRVSAEDQWSSHTVPHFPLE